MNTFFNKIDEIIKKTREGNMTWRISVDYSKKVYTHTRSSRITLIYETAISDSYTLALSIGRKEEWADVVERLVECDFFELFIFQGKELLSYFSSDDFRNDLTMRELSDVVRFSMLKNINIE